ncbi:uncharacterized protein LOC128854919 isoform X1 [Anastrepha ludens]|uniref:uncharacterized protein LOC128854919 isoform X1 n=2 Tax=Anastrepha ludens TaxID=28586 RepID=UPI0023AE7388|nr:uncharacterized protein LOC128854919 isoform X1 [Anastrepha ludens]
MKQVTKKWSNATKKTKMLLHRLHTVIWLLSGVIGLYAYPTINLPLLFGPSVHGENTYRFKKSGLEIHSDTDVVELENLKGHYDNENAEVTEQKPTYPDQTFEPYNVDKTVNAEPLSESQELEHQLEQMPAITTKLEKSTTTELPLVPVVPDTRGEQQSPVEGSGMHRPPTLQHDNGGKALAEAGGSTSGQQQTAESGTAITAGGNPPAPSAIKPFYGAARLAFGQNPEVLPTTTTTSTKMTTSATSTSTSTTTTTTTTEAPIQSNSDGKSTTAVESDTLPVDVETVGLNGKEIMGTNPSAKLTEQIKSTAQRRSVTLMPPQQTVGDLLKRHNGQISPLDMAQYVFWTGDEAGVARAVEELIDRGVISRENALAFLREVRVGIEYLQQSYTNRIFPEAGLNINIDKKMFDFPQTKPIAPTTVLPINEKPLLPYLRLDRLLHASNKNPTKSVENISVWHKLQALNNDGNQDLNDYDETGERTKISQFLYNEYTLEDILYKLAKIMFAQSLSHGSDEAQHELQKLTEFLEREGSLGVIPIDLQKKVLHILFRALSDTLAERPELLSAANVNLANPYNRLPMRILEP